MHSLFLDLTIVIGISAILAIIFKYLKQPPMLAYILTGILVAQALLLTPDSKDALKSLGEIGITLLLFMLGLELNFGELKSVGRVALITGIGQILFTSIIGFVICTLLGFPALESLYISVAITFSSTIVIVKLLSDKKDLNSLYGKISIGFLLVQDFVAIIALIFLSSFSAGSAPNIADVLMILIKAVILFIVAVVLSQFIFPHIIRSISRSQEILFLSSLAWAFGFAAFVSSSAIGFSIEIGGFLAGLALGNSGESTQIISKVKSLRDFFIVIFFVVMGSNLALNNFGEVIIPALILSVFVLVGNPIIVFVILKILGYKNRTSFLSGLAVAQISEFSLILALVGNRLGHVNEQTLSMLTLIALITFTFSTYMIVGGERIFEYLRPLVKRFEVRREKGFRSDNEDMDGHIIIIGAHRMGKDIVKALKKEKDNLLIIDFNPDIYEDLKEEGYNVLFGDVTDSDIVAQIKAENAKFIVSTLPNFEDNLILIKTLEGISKDTNRKKDDMPITIVTAHSEEDKADLIDAGADYVIMPYAVAGEYIGRLIRRDKVEELE